MTLYYVDSTRPDDTGDGLSWATAKKTVAGVQAIGLASGDTVYLQGTFREACILTEDGVTWDAVERGLATISGADALVNGSFSLHSGNTYKITMADPIVVLEDDGLLDGLDGRDNKVMLVEAASVAAVESTPGTFYHDGADLYVQASDSSDITTNGYLYEGGARATGIAVTGDGVTLNRLKAEGCTSEGISTTAAGLSVLGCESRFHHDASVKIAGPAQGTLLEECYLHDTVDASKGAVYVTGAAAVGNIARRCRLEQPTTAAIAVRVANGSILVEQSYCASPNAQQCLYVTGTSATMRLRHNVIYGAVYQTVGFRYGAAGGEVHGNVFLPGGNTSETMLYSKDVVGEIVATNNTFYDPISFDSNIKFQGTAQRIIFRNNIVVTGTASLANFWAETTANVDADYNLYYGSSVTWKWGGTDYTDFASYQAASGETNSEWGDPSFVDATNGNLALAQDSPAIGMGQPAGEILDDLSVIQAHHLLLQPGATWPGGVGTQLQGIDGLGWTVGAFARSVEQVAEETLDDTADLAAIDIAVAAIDGNVEDVLSDTTEIKGHTGTTGVKLADSEDVYHADLMVTVDTNNSRDEYTAQWFKNGVAVTSGITSPTLQVIKRADGSDLIAATAMTQIASTGVYTLDEATNQLTKGEAAIAIVTATIGGGTRTWRQNIGRDDAR